MQSAVARSDIVAVKGVSVVDDILLFFVVYPHLLFFLPQ